MLQLYGDGIHDDTAAIQERIDGVCETVLPMPEVEYLISKPLVLHSGSRLVLPRYARIKLAKGSNCPMVQNELVEEAGERCPDQPLYDFVNIYSPDHLCENIEVIGGIWDFNNMEQQQNPIVTRNYEIYGYGGFGFLFYHVRNLRISSITFKDPVTYAVIFDTVSYFTVDNVVFDFNYGNPHATNMDGIHLNGNCHFGRMTNLQGACYDDLVALNADEGTKGPITDIEIDGIFSEDCHSAARLLSVKHKVENIHISNVYGTYYQYCIGLTKWFPGETEDNYQAITLEHIYASKAERLPVYNKGDSYVFPLIFIQGSLVIRDLKIADLHRNERINTIDTVFVGEGTTIENLTLDRIYTKNLTGQGEMPLYTNRGKVHRLFAREIFADGEELSLD